MVLRLVAIKQAQLDGRLVAVDPGRRFVSQPLSMIGRSRAGPAGRQPYPQPEVPQLQLEQQEMA